MTNTPPGQPEERGEDPASYDTEEAVSAAFGPAVGAQWSKATAGRRVAIVKQLLSQKQSRAEQADRDASAPVVPVEGEANENMPKGMPIPNVDALREIVVQRTARKSALRMILELGQSYVKTPDGDAKLRARMIRYKAELGKPHDAERLAVRALQCHVLDSFINKDAVDFNEIIHDVRANPLCAPLDDDKIQTLYVIFINVLLQDVAIEKETFDDDE
jgi:hypothetical protein